MQVFMNSGASFPYLGTVVQDISSETVHSDSTAHRTRNRQLDNLRLFLSVGHSHYL
jgi:hypothetical protein